MIALDVIRKSDLLRARWKNYQRKYEYAKDIEFDEILNCIEQIIEQFDVVVAID